MEGQRKGDCSHIMASVDPHGLCVRCRECDLVNAPCSVCLAMTSMQREAAQLAYARRRRRLQRRKDRASSVCSSTNKHSSGSLDRPTPEPPVAGRGEPGAAPAKGGCSTAAASRPPPVPSLRRDDGQGPPVTPSTWVDGRGSASPQAQIDGEPASPRDRAWVDGCSADSSPRRVESRGRVRHSRSRTPIGRRHRSPSVDRETSEPEPILPYSGVGRGRLGCGLGLLAGPQPNTGRSPVAIPVSWRGLQRGPGPGSCPGARLRSLT